MPNGQGTNSQGNNYTVTDRGFIYNNADGMSLFRINIKHE